MNHITYVSKYPEERNYKDYILDRLIREVYTKCKGISFSYIDHWLIKL